MRKALTVIVAGLMVGVSTLASASASAQAAPQEQPAYLQPNYVPYGYQTPPRLLPLPPLPMRRPRTLPYQGGPIPPFAHVEQHRPAGMIVAGGVLLLVSYATSIALWNINSGSSSCVAAAAATCSNSPWMALPVVGPWLALTDNNTAHALGPVLVIDGIVQALGFTLGLVGLQIKHPTLVFDTPRIGMRPRRNFDVAAVPGSGPTGLGLSLVGHF